MKPLAIIKRPPIPAGTYSEAQWQAIRASLVPVGVSLDVPTPTLKWELPDTVPAGPLLRDTLQGLACHFALHEPLQHRQFLQMVKDASDQLATLKAASAVFGRYSAKTITHHDREVDAIVAQINALTAKQQVRLNGLRMLGRGANARKMHVTYWRDLTHLWLTLTENADRRRHKDLHRFLLTCSSPVFPAATTDKALTAFIERHFPANER